MQFFLREKGNKNQTLPRDPAEKQDYVNLQTRKSQQKSSRLCKNNGFVTDAARSVPECTRAFVCGPTPMLRAVSALPQLQNGQFSFEARMACGFGACMGCTIETAGGPRRVCKDGPVFRKEELAW